MEEFLSGQHPFEEYQEQVVRFHNLSYEINCDSAKVSRHWRRVVDGARDVAGRARRESWKGDEKKSECDADTE